MFSSRRRGWTKQPENRWSGTGLLEDPKAGGSLVEWPLPGMADWIEVPLEGNRWQISAEQLFDTNSDRGMRCSDWLGQQVVMFDQRGIALHELIRAVANYDGAHAVSVGRLAVVEGESPSMAAKEPDIHILRNITFFGVGYAELVVVEAAMYLFGRLMDEASIARAPRRFLRGEAGVRVLGGPSRFAQTRLAAVSGWGNGVVLSQTGGRTPHHQGRRAPKTICSTPDSPSSVNGRSKSVVADGMCIREYAQRARREILRHPAHGFRASGGRSAEQGGSDLVGWVDGDEHVGGEQVVFAAFVDDAQVAVGAGVLVGQRPVDLVELQRSWVVRVVDADDVVGGLRSCAHCRSR